MTSDNWYVFSRADFSGNRQRLESKNAGLGANKIAFTSNLCIQPVLFILQLGYDPGVKYCGGTPEKWIMEPYINLPPWDLNHTDVNSVHDKGVYICGYGWY